MAPQIQGEDNTTNGGTSTSTSTSTLTAEAGSAVGNTSVASETQTTSGSVTNYDTTGNITVNDSTAVSGDGTLNETGGATPQNPTTPAPASNVNIPGTSIPWLWIIIGGAALFFLMKKE